MLVLSKSEYVMWYHGRCKELSEDKTLPPLSTGRVGRAKSRNGLIWEREDEGSVDADREGVSLGLNTESWWGFDTAHLGLGQVLMPMATPSVRAEGGVYIMYYHGGNFDETRIADYLDEEKAANVPEGATIAGMKMKIGAAVSQDGTTWGRIEGEDPSGACVVPFDRDDPNVDASLDFPEELYCGWPEVVVNPPGEGESNPPPKDRDNFFMYYSTMLKDTKEKAIGFATSENGFKWTKKGICLSPTDETLDSMGCARCHVVKKAHLNEDQQWEEDKTGWIMYYEGVGLDGRHRVLAAESDDLLTWRKLGLVKDVGEDGSWDEKGVGSPHVIRLDDGSMRMYYTGESMDGSTAIGVAKSVDLLNWEREQAGVSTFAF